MSLLVNKLHFRLLGFTPRRSLSLSLTLIVNSTIVTHSRFVTTTSRQRRRTETQQYRPDELPQLKDGRRNLFRHNVMRQNNESL